MTYFLLRDYNIQLKKELLWSLWVVRKFIISSALQGASIYKFLLLRPFEYE